MKHFTALFSALLCLFSAKGQNSVADSNNVFAFKLYQQVKSDKNLFYSPFSISFALAMTYAGAKNETENQMRKTLHFTPNAEAFHVGFKKLYDSVEADNTVGIQMNIANSLWLGKKYTFLGTYLNLVKANYHSELREVDFIEASARQQAVKDINSWVEQKTNNKIKNILHDGDVDESTALVLVNAIYFNGKWQTAFRKEQTKQGDFNTNASSKTAALFMNSDSKTKYNYYADDMLSAIELPYKQDKVSMVVILPNAIDGIDNLEKKLDYKYYSKIIKSFNKEDVQVSLPKFKTAAYFRLEDVLSKMGMPVAFSPNADFSGMDGSPDLCISHLIHKAYVDVSEEGTEAAAATAVVMETCDVHIPKIFCANHPFIFVIKDNNTGSILFMGKIMNPNDKGE